MLVKFHTWWRTAEPELLSGPTALNNLLLGSSSGKNTGFEVRFKKWLYIEITKSESRLHMRTLGPRDNGLADTPPCSHCQNKKPRSPFTSLEEHTPLNQSLQAGRGLFCLFPAFNVGTIEIKQGQPGHFSYDCHLPGLGGTVSAAHRQTWAPWRKTSLGRQCAQQ